MKKSLAVVLILLFVFSMACTALAAPGNQFADVPSNHWAYDAISKLAKAGIVSGYDDRNFHGDKTLTRYEMAQLVANAINKEGKANTEQKTIIDKLITEFASELNALGVRVANLEKKPSSFAISGDVRLRYRTNADQSATNLSTTIKSRFDSRVRVAISDENFVPDFSYYARIQGLNNTYSQNTNSQDINSATGSLAFDRFEIDWKHGNSTVQLGRYAPMLGPSLLVWSYGFPVDGINIMHKMGNLTATMGFADLTAAFNNAAVVVNTNKPSVTAQMASLQYDFAKGANVSLAYLKSMKPNSSITSSGYKFKQFDLTTSIKTGEFTILLEGIRNDYANLPANAEKNGFYGRLQYKTLDLQQPGSNILFVDYMKLGNWAVDSTFAMNNVFGDGGNGIGLDGAKGFGAGFAVTIAKNCDFWGAAYWLKPYDAARTGAAFNSYKPSFQAWTNFRF